MEKIFLSIAAIFLMACGGENPSSDSARNTPSKSSCLADYVENNEIEKMITAEQVASIVGKSVSDLEYSESKAMSAKYSTFGYEWTPEEERMMTMEMEIPGRDEVIRQEVPLDNQVDIGYVDVFDPEDKTPLEYFDFVYGPKTEEQKQQAKEGIDRAQKESEKVDEQSAEIIKSMVDKQKDLQVEDVGDRAYGAVSNVKGMVYYNIKVLHANTMFEVTVDVSDDSQEDMRVAREIAKQIIANCN